MCRNAGRSKAASEQAEQLFRVVSEAYEVLGNGEDARLSEVIDSDTVI